MVSINTVILGGNLTRDPEVRYTPQGTPVATFGLAVNRAYKTKDGEQKEEVCFIEIETWGRQAEICEQYLRKGRPVLVEGNLKYDTWESNDGQKRSRHKIRANRVQFLGAPGRPGASGQEGMAPPPAIENEVYPDNLTPPPGGFPDGGDVPF